MKKFVFAALTVSAVIFATTSGAFQRFPQVQPTEDGGSRLVDLGKRGGTWLVDHSRSRAHVVIRRHGTVETVG